MLGIGWLLGGVVGVGTVLYALAIGPLLHLLLPRLQVRVRVRDGDRGERAAVAGPTAGRRALAAAAPVARLPACRVRRSGRSAGAAGRRARAPGRAGRPRGDRPPVRRAAELADARRHRHPRRGVHHHLPAAGRLRAARAADRAAGRRAAGVRLLRRDDRAGRRRSWTAGPTSGRCDAIDIVVRRNAFGRQVDSFETDLEIDGMPAAPSAAVFIRAPWVERAGPGVDGAGQGGGAPGRRPRRAPCWPPRSTPRSAATTGCTRCSWRSCSRT